MKWVLGLDLANSAKGAAHFAAWTQEHHGGRVAGAHVMQLPESSLPEWSEAMALRVQGMLNSLVRGAGLDETFQVELLREPDAEKALVELRRKHEADAVVIGRRGKTGELALVRLGAVARRAIRQASGPLVVVPPDVDMDSLTGPILLATDGTERTAGEAARFAAQVATDWKRPWHACLVAEHVDEYAATYFTNTESLDATQRAMRDASQRRLDMWADECPVTPDEKQLLEGNRTGALLNAAKEHNSPLLVVGSRRLGTADRLFTSSVGMELAAHAGCPVAIVPPLD